jgi:NADPH2:quinone reductase
MKAGVIYENASPDVLRYEDVADPECPDGRTLIDVEAISIEGGDLRARAGSPPRSVPHIVSYLAAGTVVAVGAGVEERAVSDRIVPSTRRGRTPQSVPFPLSANVRSRLDRRLRPNGRSRQ